MDPDVRRLVVGQLLVIVIPVGTLIALWITMLNWKFNCRGVK